MKRYVDARRHDAVAIVGRRERLYAGYQRALQRHSRSTMVGARTGLCIEAPPGSGNTFFTTGFAIANPDVSLAHHHHVYAQVKRAQRFSIPLLLILREPLACVLSRAVSWRHPIIVGPVYREWLSFWRPTIDHLRDAVVVDFDTLVSRPSETIERLNSRFGTRYSAEFPSDREVFAAMDADRAVHARPMDLNPNRPDERKRELRAWLRPHAENHRLAPVADALYRRIAQLIEANG